MAGTPADSRGWGCDKVVSEQDFRKLVQLRILVFVIHNLHYLQNEISNSKYIHIK